LSWQTALIFSKQGLLLLVGHLSIRQLVVREMDFRWMALWELNPDVFRKLWPMASATWGEITLAEGLHDGGRRPCPF
jgi:hypothetical protein